MRLHKLARKARLEALSKEEDVCTLLLDWEKPRQACRIFLNWLKDNGRRASRHEVSQFGWDLEARRIRKDFRYSQRNLYRTILRHLVDFGFVEQRYWRYEGRHQWVYVPVLQPIQKRPPGGRNFWNMTWQLCEKWNQEWEP